MKAEVQLIGFAALSEELRGLYKRFKGSKKPLTEQIAARFKATIEGNIKAGGVLSSAAGHIAESTLDIRKERGQGSAPLIATGAMMGSVDTFSDEETAASGPTVDYAAHVQFGIKRTSGAIPGKRVPARPFVLIGTSDIEGAMDVLEHGILGNA